MLIHGDCVEQLKVIPDTSVDSLVTDPPAGISFMGKDWDHHRGGRKEWVAWMTDVMAECMRVLKPGAHGLVWALPRTSHWTATALEDAGFEIRDVMTHLFGSGFPKSLDVSKAIDKAAGAERLDLSPNPHKVGRTKDMRGGRFVGSGDADMELICRSTAPATDAAKQWQGFGTALKPASEHWILVRKPCSEKTVAKNVLKWGTGALNIDASRIGTDLIEKGRAGRQADQFSKNAYANGKGFSGHDAPTGVANGRFPANLVLSCSEYCTEDQHDIECAIQALDQQSGVSKSTTHMRGKGIDGATFKTKTSLISERGISDSGGASRFFYCAKSSKADKNAGLEGMALKEGAIHLDGGPWKENKTAKNGVQNRLPRANHHPTVKSTKLMTYLIKLITPPGGVVLDPFMGSGSTGKAATELGFEFIGIEKEYEYYELAQARIGGIDAISKRT